MTQRFVTTMRLPEDVRLRRSVLAPGSVAAVAQGATVVLVGSSLLLAAWTENGAEVGGLDAALTGIAGSTFGVVLLIAVGVAVLDALVRARIART